MAISFREFTGLSQARSGDYRFGLGKKKSCCSSCASGGPCTGCGPGKPCTCKNGLGQGQEDLEPPEEGWGDQYVQTTIPGQTVMSKRQGVVEPERRIDITRMVEELEFLAGTPGVHPRVLAQKVWEVRRALMGSGGWSWASYSDPTRRYDSKGDLEARLQAVERVLGVANVSPKVMSQLYGLGGLGRAKWLEVTDPVEKLASCIRGKVCAPLAYCCPPRTCYQQLAGLGAAVRLPSIKVVPKPKSRPVSLKPVVKPVQPKPAPPRYSGQRPGETEAQFFARMRDAQLLEAMRRKAVAPPSSQPSSYAPTGPKRCGDCGTRLGESEKTCYHCGRRYSAPSSGLSFQGLGAFDQAMNALRNKLRQARGEVARRK